MTNEELKNAIKNINANPSIDPKTKAIAAKAVRRLIPAPPECRQTGEPALVRRYFCPVCKAYFGSQVINAKPQFHQPPFCECGQAIDWSGKEEGI